MAAGFQRYPSGAGQIIPVSLMNGGEDQRFLTRPCH
jgi:hypothetical protein